MPVIMFWNVQKGKAVPYIQQACADNNVDILILAEDDDDNFQTSIAINKIDGYSIYYEYRPVDSKLRFFTRMPLNSFSPISDDRRASMRLFTPPVGLPLLIVAAHLPSKLHSDEKERYFYARELSKNILEAEERVGHSNTIVIGDLNMNPFEDPIVSADGLHGVMDKTVALKLNRTLYGKKWHYFYNPMWSKMGDESDGPPGTYYFSGSDVNKYYWNSFDQFLIRPQLIPFYDSASFKVITRVGQTDLLKNSVVSHAISDHLPIVLNLDIERVI